eukprot:4511021-Amphidinium_carterae.1
MMKFNQCGAKDNRNCCASVNVMVKLARAARQIWPPENMCQQINVIVLKNMTNYSVLFPYQNESDDQQNNGDNGLN